MKMSKCIRRKSVITDIVRIVSNDDVTHVAIFA